MSTGDAFITSPSGESGQAGNGAVSADATADPPPARPPEAGVEMSAGAREADESAARLRVAAQTAESLASLLREMVAESAAAAERERELRALAEQVEASASALTVFRDQMLAVAIDGTSPEDSAAMLELVEALGKRPNDLLLMVKLSEHATQLEAIVRAHDHVLTALRQRA